VGKIVKKNYNDLIDKQKYEMNYWIAARLARNKKHIEYYDWMFTPKYPNDPYHFPEYSKKIGHIDEHHNDYIMVDSKEYKIDVNYKVWRCGSNYIKYLPIV
jgi:hypothetical protein